MQNEAVEAADDLLNVEYCQKGSVYSPDPFYFFVFILQAGLKVESRRADSNR